MGKCKDSSGSVGVGSASCVIERGWVVVGAIGEVGGWGSCRELAGVLRCADSFNLKGKF